MVILKKALGNIDIKKFREILLLVTDFNIVHKIIFNRRIMSRLKEANTILNEIIGSRRIQAATYLALNKKLILDIANIRKLLTVVICADVTNYYDRVTYLFASLCVQYFGLEVIYLLVLFRIIQMMKMYLRTAFELSETYYSDKNSCSF